MYKDRNKYGFKLDKVRSRRRTNLDNSNVLSFVERLFLFAVKVEIIENVVH